VSKELPEILSDEEFARMLQERDKESHALSTTRDQWKKSASIPVHQPSDGLPESTIEQYFPRIAQKLVLVWPSEACAVYLTSLIVNEREARQGFPPQVLDDLLMLHSMNDMILRSLQPRSAVSSTTDKLPPHF
jgi:hypothetical protein